MSATTRALVAAMLLVAPLLHGADEQAPPVPQPTLPPEARTLQIRPSSDDSQRSRASSAQPAALVDDISALKQAVERVRAARVQANMGEEAPNGAARITSVRAAVPSGGKHVADGSPRISSKYGAERLSAQRFADGTTEITASIERDHLENVLHELVLLLGRPLDDAQLVDGRRAVSLHVKDLSPEITLDRLLGQVGLSWRESGSQHTIVIIDLAQHPLPTDQAEDIAQRALLEATRDRQTPTAAEAFFVLASRDLAAGRQVDAMRRFSTLAEDYGASKDPALRIWGTRAIRGVGDAMMALGQFQDARGVYLNYIGRANDKDGDLPAVYLDAARAGRELGLAHQDGVAFDEAIDTLHNLLERFANTPSAAPQVTLARLMVGQLLFEAARYREAETQLKLFAQASGGKIGSQISYWLAECAFQLGHLDEAQPAFIRLNRAWHAGKADPAMPADLYAIAAFRIGQCYERRSEPKFVHALFAFLRARHDFPRSTVDSEILISVARCYSELERDDDTVNTLWELLKDDGINDPQKRQLWLDDSLNQLNGHLGDYPGPVRAKVLFYIAQADYRRAVRDRTERANAANDAIHHYERLLTENPPAELRHAARLGLARAALLGGQDERGVEELKELLGEPNLSTRDRDFAAQLLGTYYHDKGMLREAIKAYRGEAGN